MAITSYKKTFVLLEKPNKPLGGEPTENSQKFDNIQGNSDPLATFFFRLSPLDFTFWGPAYAQVIKFDHQCYTNSRPLWRFCRRSWRGSVEKDGLTHEEKSTARLSVSFNGEYFKHLQSENVMFKH